MPRPLLLCLFLSTFGNAFAAQPHLVSSLLKDLKSRTNSSFDLLVKSWEQRYGTQAFFPLIEIVKNRKNSDPDRYIAVMSAAKLGGTESASALIPFLKDPSWMVRSATLKALTALGNPLSADATLPLLRDPALVVRVEAVEAVRVLKPRGAALALVNTLGDQGNFHGGKALWVPQKALTALLSLQAREVAPQLLAYLGQPLFQNDPELSSQTRKTVELLTRRN